MNFMNVVFTAQKLSVVIDACILDNESGLLQQVVTADYWMNWLHLLFVLSVIYGTFVNYITLHYRFFNVA